MVREQGDEVLSDDAGGAENADINSARVITTRHDRLSVTAIE